MYKIIGGVVTFQDGSTVQGNGVAGSALTGKVIKAHGSLTIQNEATGATASFTAKQTVVLP